MVSGYSSTGYLCACGSVASVLLVFVDPGVGSGASRVESVWTYFWRRRRCWKMNTPTRAYMEKVKKMTNQTGP